MKIKQIRRGVILVCVYVQCIGLQCTMHRGNMLPRRAPAALHIVSQLHVCEQHTYKLHLSLIVETPSDCPPAIGL